MTRVKRMQPVVRAVGHDERERAASLAKCERLVADAERRLADLETYRSEYAGGFGRRIAGGISATGLRDYQTFLARLSQAIEAQAAIVADVRLARDRAQDEWRGAAQRAKSIDHVLERWRAEERASLEQREQRETDERARQQRRPRTGR
ncbi:MAG: hypothetical protein CMLOHMNK_00676 [Steroidobacteraceae bacterium]|nr:hypothetical protein [Steroidobacteraceae bacterium]